MAVSDHEKTLPSSRWSSFEGWDFNGMKERLENALQRLDKSVLLAHAKMIKGQDVTMSEPFSAGQYWICFEMVASDSTLVIARVRLPRHPDSSPLLQDEDEAYAVQCEVATMRHVQQQLPGVRLPVVYAYEGPGSQLAGEAGAAYMLIEGFYGNTLMDVAPDICQLSHASQSYIISQWTKVQAELATLTYPQIGSISYLSSATGQPVIKQLASAISEGLQDRGPFQSAVQYFKAIGQASINRFKAALSNAHTDATIGAHVFYDIVTKTDLFDGAGSDYALSHMDLGAQNILVDEEFTFLAVIDWEFAQTAPWQTTHFPMPFPLHESDEEIAQILANSKHVAFPAVSRQEYARMLYVAGFRHAEEELRKQGRPVRHSLANGIQSKSSRIYVCFLNLGRMAEADQDLVKTMAHLGFGFEGVELENYIASVMNSFDDKT